MFNFEVISLPSDELAPLGARPTVNTGMNNFMSNHTLGIITVKFNHHIGFSVILIEIFSPWDSQACKSMRPL